MVTYVCTCGQQTLSQHANLELQMPPPRPTQMGSGFAPSVASARADTGHATTQNTPSGVDASMEDGEGYPLGFGPVHLMADVPNTTPGVTQTTHNDDSAKRRLENFTKKVVRKRAFLLKIVSHQSSRLQRRCYCCGPTV